MTELKVVESWDEAEARQYEDGVIHNRARELAYREGRGIGTMTVKLWWVAQTNEVGIDLKDRGINTSFLVPLDKALRAFYSPWGYLPPHIKPLYVVEDV